MPLVLELLVALAASAALAGLVRLGPAPLATVAIGASLVLAIPCVAAVLLGSPAHGAPALALLLLPGTATAWRRVSRAQLATARALGAGPWLIARALVGPAVAPFLLASLLGGGAVLGAKAWLERAPAGTFELSDPPTGIG